MPPAINRPCRRPGCPRVTIMANGFCDACQDYARQQEAARMAKKKVDSFYAKGQWPKTRKWYLGQHPMCEVCGQKKATEVDHIMELADGGDRHSVGNLQALCHRCHMRKTAAVKRRRNSSRLS